MLSRIEQRLPEAQYVPLNVFIAQQQQCNGVRELAKVLNMKESAVKARIKHIVKKGYGDYLRPYNDVIGKRGKKPLAEQMKAIPKYKKTADETVGNGEASTKAIK